MQFLHITHVHLRSNHIWGLTPFSGDLAECKPNFELPHIFGFKHVGQLKFRAKFQIQSLRRGVFALEFNPDLASLSPHTFYIYSHVWTSSHRLNIEWKYQKSKYPPICAPAATAHSTVAGSWPVLCNSTKEEVLAYTTHKPLNQWPKPWPE